MSTLFTEPQTLQYFNTMSVDKENILIHRHVFFRHELGIKRRQAKKEAKEADTHEA